MYNINYTTKNHSDQDFITPLLSKEQVWDGRLDIEFGIWNDIIGKIHTIDGFIKWANKIKSKKMTDIFDDKYINWQNETEFYEKK